MCTITLPKLAQSRRDTSGRGARSEGSRRTQSPCSQPGSSAAALLAATTARGLAVTRVVRGRTLLALGAHRALGDQLLERQAQLARRRAQVLVDLLDPLTRGAGHVLEDAALQGLYLVGGPLGALGAAATGGERRHPAAAAAAAIATDEGRSGSAQRGVQGVIGRLARQVGHLRDE